MCPAAPSCRHSLLPSVGATLAVARPTDSLQTNRRGGRLCPPAIHAGTPCHALRRGRWSCCGAQNFCAALRLSLKILTAATRSSRFIRHRRRSIRSPHRPAHGTPCSVSLRDQCAHWSWQSASHTLHSTPYKKTPRQMPRCLACQKSIFTTLSRFLKL